MTPISATSGFLTVTDLNDFNGPAQTTNLGVRSSNLFGRAIQNKTANSYIIEIATYLPSAMTAAAKPSEQPRTESCVASGNGRCEA